MATKPATLPRPWATLANYDTGPFIGQPMKVDPGVGIAASGHRPGAAFPTPAEYENYQQYHVTNWVDTWLALGSSTGAADAHIVEANSVGRSALVGLTLDDAVDEVVLDIVSSNTFVPAVQVDATAGGGTAFQAIIDPDATGFTTTIGAGDGRGFSVDMVNSGINAAGLLVTDDVASEGDGVRVNMVGTGYGIFASTSGTGPAGRFVSTGVQVALSVAGSASSVTGAFMSGGTSRVLNIDADGAALAAQMVGGDTAGTNALLVTCGNNTGKAIVAAVPNASTSASRGFYCSTGNGAGIAAEFISSGTGASGNYAISLTGDNTSPTTGIVFMTPQNADPSGGGPSGALAMSTAKGLTHGVFADGTWRSYWSSLNGYTCAFATLTNRTTVGANLSYTVVGTITTSSSGNEVKVVGAQIIIRCVLSVRPILLASEVYLGVRVQDTTGAPSTVFIRSGAGGGDNSGYKLPDNSQTWSPIAFTFIATVPATGTRSYTLAINRDNAVNCEVRVRDVEMDFIGTVD